MRRYIEQLKARPSHEKRRFSLHASAVIVGIIFVGWISTLGMRLARDSSGAQVAGADDNNGPHLVAAVQEAGSAISQQGGQIRAAVSGLGQSQMNWTSANADASDSTATAPRAVPATPSATVIEVPASGGSDANQ